MKKIVFILICLIASIICTQAQNPQGEEIIVLNGIVDDPSGFNYDAYYNHTPLAIGYGVTPDVEDGEVIVKKGYKLIIKKGSGGVMLDYGFECEKGAIIEIK